MSTKNAIEETKDTAVESTRERPEFVPATDIYEKPDAILLRCDMPGVSEDKVDVTLEDNVLTVVGEQDDVEFEGFSLVAAEYRTGVYRRSFSIRQAVDADGIKARLKNGVLDIEVPTAKEAQPRKIAIEA